MPAILWLPPSLFFFFFPARMYELQLHLRCKVVVILSTRYGPQLTHYLKTLGDGDRVSSTEELAIWYKSKSKKYQPQHLEGLFGQSVRTNHLLHQAITPIMCIFYLEVGGSIIVALQSRVRSRLRRDPGLTFALMPSQLWTLTIFRLPTATFIWQWYIYLTLAFAPSTYLLDNQIR